MAAAGDSRTPSADDLVVLLSVGRTGRYSTAAEELGLAHTTISRRIASLERALGGRVLAKSGGVWELTALGQEALVAGEAIEAAVRGLVGRGSEELQGVIRTQGTDGFSAYVLAPAAARMQLRHPKVAVEVVTATRRASQQRSGIDIEVVVGEPQVHRALAMNLCAYRLGLYASKHYLQRCGTPRTLDELASHPFIYFIDSMLQVDDLDASTNAVPRMRETITSTNTFVHVEATRASAGIGLLPFFMADRHDDLVRILEDDVVIPLNYWLVTRDETLRRPEVAAFIDAIKVVVAELRSDFMGDGRR